MNKKLFLIPVAFGLALWIVYDIFSKAETGDRFEVVVPDLAKDTSAEGLKRVCVYLDNSGSMKGYVDFASIANGAQAQASVIGTLSNMMDNVHSVYNIEAICKCGGFNYEREAFLKGMENFSIFKGAVTELHNMVQMVADSTRKEDVSVIATDMVMSYGKAKLEAERDSFYNFHQLAQLGAQVHNAMEKCKNKGLSVMVLQYYSDFNGKYYYNYTENLKANVNKNQLMKKRPFYLVAIGAEENLKSMMVNNVCNKANHVYSSFEMDAPSKKETYSIQEDKNCRVAWIIGDPDNKGNDGSIMTNTEFGDEPSTLYFICKKIAIPGYISLGDDGKLVPEWDTSIVSNVEEMAIETDSIQKFKVILMPHSKLQTSNRAWIRLNSNIDWIANASTNDDTQGDITAKTWGFSTVIQNINKAYRGTEKPKAEKIAEFTFNVIIK